MIRSVKGFSGSSKPISISNNITKLKEMIQNVKVNKIRHAEILKCRHNGIPLVYSPYTRG